jgi:histidinol-phosphate aminotransferase
VRQVHDSDANFLLARFERQPEVARRLAEAGVIVRDMSAMAGLEDALRITVGTRRDNLALLAALRGPA